MGYLLACLLAVGMVCERQIVQDEQRRTEGQGNRRKRIAMRDEAKENKETKTMSGMIERNGKQEV